MSKVFIMCGKLCSGKSTYANKISSTHKAVILSIDEIMLSVFGQDAGEKHDYYVERIKAYQYAKSVEIAESGINVVLDWGFWTRKEREYAKEYYTSRHIDYEFYYLDVDSVEWNRRIQKRNQDVLNHESDMYYVDEGLADKFESIFEVPTKDEIDVWVNS